jgi:peptide/nickel transport system permease protein
MGLYWIKRLLWVIPILWIISVATFFLSKLTPGDPVLLHMNIGEERRGMSNLDQNAFERLYARTAEQFNLDKPHFYFSLVPLCAKDAYQTSEFSPYLKKRYIFLAIKYGSALKAKEYLNALSAVTHAIHNSVLFSNSLENQLNRLDTTTQKSIIEETIQRHLIPVFSETQEVKDLQAAWIKLRDHEALWSSRAPILLWHGNKNQYHIWISQLFKGDLGPSLTDGRPVSQKVLKALGWTLPFNFLVFFLIIILSIYIGIVAAIKSDSWWAKVLENSLLLIYAIPLFWLCTLAVSYLAGSKSGNIFPSPAGIDHLMATGFWQRVWTSLHFMLLPLICLVVSSLAGLSRQVRHLMEQELQKPYIQASIVRGISQRRIIWRYALSQVMIPLTAYIGRLIPALFSGLIVVESIFNIPGMGSLLVKAIYTRDWPVAFPVFMISAVLTVLGVLLADILLARLSPLTIKSIDRRL